MKNITLTKKSMASSFTKLYTQPKPMKMFAEIWIRRIDVRNNRLKLTSGTIWIKILVHSHSNIYDKIHCAHNLKSSIFLIIINVRHWAAGKNQDMWKGILSCMTGIEQSLSWDLTFSWQWRIKLQSSGLWHLVGTWQDDNISEMVISYNLEVYFVRVQLF
jgi:hypothetical protein